MNDSVAVRVIEIVNVCGNAVGQDGRTELQPLAGSPDHATPLAFRKRARARKAALCNRMRASVDGDAQDVKQAALGRFAHRLRDVVEVQTRSKSGLFKNRKFMGFRA